MKIDQIIGFNTIITHYDIYKCSHKTLITKATQAILLELNNSLRQFIYHPPNAFKLQKFTKLLYSKRVLILTAQMTQKYYH